MRPSYFGGRGDCDSLNGSHNDLKGIDVLAALPTAERDFRLANTRKFFGQLKSLGMSVKLLLPADPLTGVFFQPHCKGGDNWFLSQIGDQVDDLSIAWGLTNHCATRRIDVQPNLRSMSFSCNREARLRAEAVFVQPFWHSLRMDFPNLRRLKVVIPALLYSHSDEAFIASVLGSGPWTTRREPDAEGELGRFVTRYFVRIDAPDSQPASQSRPKYECPALKVIPTTVCSRSWQLTEYGLMRDLQSDGWLSTDNSWNQNRIIKYDYRTWYHQQGWTGEPMNELHLAEMVRIAEEPLRAARAERARREARAHWAQMDRFAEERAREAEGAKEAQRPRLVDMKGVAGMFEKAERAESKGEEGAEWAGLVDLTGVAEMFEI